MIQKDNKQTTVCGLGHAWPAPLQLTASQRTGLPCAILFAGAVRDPSCFGANRFALRRSEAVRIVEEGNRASCQIGLFGAFTWLRVPLLLLHAALLQAALGALSA